MLRDGQRVNLEWLNDPVVDKSLWSASTKWKMKAVRIQMWCLLSILAFRNVQRVFQTCSRLCNILNSYLVCHSVIMWWDNCKQPNNSEFFFLMAIPTQVDKIFVEYNKLPFNHWIICFGRPLTWTLPCHFFPPFYKQFKTSISITESKHTMLFPVGGGLPCF